MTRPSVQAGLLAIRRHPAVVSVLDQYASIHQLRHRDRALLAGANVLDVMSVSILVPLLPAYATETGADPVLLGVMFAAPAATRAVLSPVAGHLADRFDRRRLIWPGTVLGGLSVTALGLVGDPVVFVALRGLDGAAAAMKGPATTAYIGDTVAAEERASALGAHKTAGMLGLAIGPAIGGAIAVVAGLSAPFVVLGTGTVVAGLGLLVSLQRVDERRRQPAGPSESLSFDPATLRRLGSVPVVTLVGSAFLAQAGTGAMSPTLAPLLERTVGAGPGYVGLAWSGFGLAMVLFTPVGGTLADRRGRKPFVVGGSLVWGFVAVGLTVASVHTVPPLLLFLGGVASALAGPALGALHYESAPADHEGTTLGIFSTATAAGMAIGPVVGGAITASVGLEALYVIIGASWFGNAGLLWLGVRETANPTASG